MTVRAGVAPDTVKIVSCHSYTLIEPNLSRTISAPVAR